MDTKEWLSYRQATVRYGVSRRTLQRLVVTGIVAKTTTPHRTPRVYLNRADLDAALNTFTPQERTV